MKKILSSSLAASLLSTSAMAGMYIGLDYSRVSNTTNKEYDGYAPNLVTNGDYDNDYDTLSFKLGFGKDGGIKTQFKFSYSSYDKEFITFGGDTKLYEFGVDVIKEFRVADSLYPFVKVGLGIGYSPVENTNYVKYTQDGIFGFSYSTGAGVLYKLTDHLDVHGGIEYIGRRYQDIEYTLSNLQVITTESTKDSGIGIFIGTNFSF
jgi:opacity protein-like surface antigen